MVRLTVRIDLDEEAAIGPGKVRLLELIAEKKSIRGAAAGMQMSYRRAWLLVREMERIMGEAVVATETGGRHGGGAALTPLGLSLVSQYRAIERRAARSVAADLRTLARTRSGGRRAASAGPVTAA